VTLSILIWLPLAIAVVAGQLPARITGRLAAAGSLVTLGIAISFLARFKLSHPGLQFVTDQVWISALGIHYKLGLDGLNVSLVVLGCLLFSASIIWAAFREWDKPRVFYFQLGLAQSGGLDGDLLTSRQFYQTDYTKPLLFMADGEPLSTRAEAQHLLGDQWGMMNETGSYPGQTWLWLYTLWYQVEPFKSSENADILVMLIMTVLSVALVCIPFLPVIRSIPRWIPMHRLIWREHYRALQTPANPAS